MKNSVKCEYCGGNKVFEPSKQILLCEHCGKVSPLSPKEISANLTRKYSLNYNPTMKLCESNQYVCSSCGAEIQFEENEEKRRCPSCGDVALVRRNGSSQYVPDGVIPFVVNRENAINIFRKWINNRKFAPRDLKEMAKLGKVSGLYVPVWNINFSLVAQYFANVTKVESTGDYQATEWHYPIQSSVEKTFLNMVRSGNSRVDDDVLLELSPFDIQGLRPYSNEYIYGFSGLNTDKMIHDKYNDILNEKKNRIENIIRNELKEKYDTIETLNINYITRSSTFNYMYVPIWANHYTYRDKKYHCYINGQTGKAIGKSPKSFWKVLTMVLGVCAGIAGVIALILKYI